MKDLSHPSFLQFADACPNLIVVVGGSGRILFANNACQRLTGYRREDLYKPDFNYLNIIAPEYRTPAKRNFNSYQRGNPVSLQETCIVKQDGMLLHLAVAIQPVLFDGRPALLGMLTDMTEYKHLEKSLSAERDRLQFFIDGMVAMVVVLDSSGKVTQINKKGCKILGYPAEKILGKGWFDHFMPPSIRPKVKDHFAELMAGRLPQASYYRNPVLTKDGREVLIEWHNNVLRDDNGAIVGTLSSGTDITGHAQTRAIIQQSDRQYKDLFENSPVGIYRTTPDGRILMANPAIVKMLRYSSFEDMARVKASEHCAPNSPRSRFLRAMKPTGSVTGFEAEWLTKDGSVLRVLENSKVVRDHKGRPLYYEGTIEDVTAQKAAKEALDRQIAFEKLVTSISVRFMNLPPPEMDKGINEALRDLGLFMGVDRGYVFQFQGGNTRTNNTHEWDRKGIKPHIRRPNLPITKFAWSNNQILRKEVVVVPHVRRLPPQAATERRAFAREKIQSLILVPLVCGARVMGFLGFDSVRKECQWTDNSISLLKIVGEIFASSMDRKREEEELLHRIEVEDIISATSTRLVHVEADQFDNAVQGVLRNIGEFSGADRSYLYQFDVTGRKVSLSHGWSRNGLPPMSPKRTSLDFASLPTGLKMLAEGKTVYVSSSATVVVPADAELAYMRKHGIKSLLCVPFTSGSRRGFLGFSSEKAEQVWPADVVTLLKIVGETLAGAMERQDAEASLRLRGALGECIAALSARLVGLPARDVETALHAALKEIQGLVGASHVSLFHIVKEEGGVRLTTEWSTRGPAPLPPGVSTLSFKGLPGILQPLSLLQVVEVPSIDHLPEHSTFERNLMKERQIGAMLLVPFVVDRNTIGYIALAFATSKPPWPKDILSLFKIIGEVLTDIFELKATSRSLDTQRNLFTALMDNIPDHIYFKDEKSRFIAANRSMYARHGFARAEDVIGKSDFDLFTEGHAQSAFDDEQEIMRTGNPVIGKEEEETWADGKTTWVSSTKLPLFNDKGKIIGTYGISRDITAQKRAAEERRKLEAQMQHTQKLESLGILSGGIAHDFNNLLMGILGNTGLALMQLTPESPSWNHIKQVETVALRAAELTNQMLAYSGKSKFVVEPFDLTTLVSEMAHLLEVSICKRIALEYQFDETIPPVEGDPSQIRQVIMNLITNASDAIGNRKGKIVITTGVINCSASYLNGCYIAQDLPPGRYVFVEVSDTGCGMDSKTQEQIFDPFFTTKVKGRGLGLAAVLGIVRSHKGTLKVYSEVGKGTNFKVLFPCSAAKPAKTTAAQKEKSAWRASGTILVVDDDEVIRLVTEQMLKAFGFSVLTAMDRHSAARQCQGNADRLAAILLDVTLSETSASELIEELRQVVGNKPIILFSGYNEVTATADMKPGSFDGFLQKPFTADALASVLREALENS